jgi:hypothetical protein
MTVLSAARRSAVASVSGAARTAVRRSLAPAVQSRNITFSSPVGGYESEKVRPKLFIPGPIEFSPEVCALPRAYSHLSINRSRATPHYQIVSGLSLSRRVYELNKLADVGRLQVLRANGSGARAHTDSTLIEDFGKCIELV